MNKQYLRDNFDLFKHFTDAEIDELDKINKLDFNINIINQDTIYDVLYNIDYYQYNKLDIIIKEIQKKILLRIITIDKDKLNNHNIYNLIFTTSWMSNNALFHILQDKLFENKSDILPVSNYITAHPISYEVSHKYKEYVMSEEERLICLEYKDCLILNENNIIDIINSLNDITILKYCNYTDEFVNYCIKLHDFNTKISSCEIDWDIYSSRSFRAFGSYSSFISSNSMINSANIQIGENCGYHSVSHKCQCDLINNLHANQTDYCYTLEALNKIKSFKCGDEPVFKFESNLKCLAKIPEFNLPNTKEDLYNIHGDKQAHFCITHPKKNIPPELLLEFKNFKNTECDFPKHINYKTLYDTMHWSKDNSEVLYDYLHKIVDKLEKMIT
jgi:hypothetical protein